MANRTIEQAYVAIDQDAIDDLIRATWNVPADQQAGAARLLSYILLKRSALRREKAKR